MKEDRNTDKEQPKPSSELESSKQPTETLDLEKVVPESTLLANKSFSSLQRPKVVPTENKNALLELVRGDKSGPLFKPKKVKRKKRARNLNKVPQVAAKAAPVKA